MWELWGPTWAWTGEGDVVRPGHIVPVALPSLEPAISNWILGVRSGALCLAAGPRVLSWGGVSVLSAPGPCQVAVPFCSTCLASCTFSVTCHIPRDSHRLGWRSVLRVGSDDTALATPMGLRQGETSSGWETPVLLLPLPSGKGLIAPESPQAPPTTSFLWLPTVLYAMNTFSAGVSR